jgi:hypothetical protein
MIWAAHAFATLAARLAALDRRIGDKDRAALVKARALFGARLPAGPARMGISQPFSPALGVAIGTYLALRRRPLGYEF